MKRIKAYSAYLALALAAQACCCGPLLAGAPLKINFQGRLDESGLPAEGSKTFVFKLYDAASGGTLLWTSQSQPLTLSQGVFSAVLSAGSPAALSTAAFAGARYVEITVDGVQLSPRQEMVSAPYALVAQALAPDAELPPSAPADGSVTDAKVVLSTAAIGSGRFTDGRLYLSTGAFFGGFNAPDKLVQLDGAGKLPALDGSQLTNLPASGAVSRAGDTMTGQLTLAGSTLTVAGSAFSVGGSTLVAAGGRVGIGTAAPNSTLGVAGAVSLPVRRVAFVDTPYLVTEADFTILADSTDGDVTVTLPAAASAPGRLYVVKRTAGANNIYLGAAAGLVEGQASQVMNSLQGETITVQSDGTDWLILNWYWQ